MSRCSLSIYIGLYMYIYIYTYKLHTDVDNYIHLDFAYSIVYISSSFRLIPLVLQYCYMPK